MEQTYPMVDNIQVRVQSHPYRMNTNNPLGNQNRFLYRMSENYRSHHSPVGFFEFKNYRIYDCNLLCNYFEKCSIYKCSKSVNPLLSFIANLKSHSNVSRSQVPGLFGLVNSPFFHIDNKSLEVTRGHKRSNCICQWDLKWFLVKNGQPGWPSG